MSIVTSSTVAAGDTVTSAERNKLREDVLNMGGDYATAGGTANALTLSLDAQITAYTEGMVVKFKASAANTGAATINVNSIGVKSIKRINGDALEADDIASGGIYVLLYDGTDFLLIGRDNGMSKADADTLTDGSEASDLHVHDLLSYYNPTWFDMDVMPKESTSGTIAGGFYSSYGGSGTISYQTYADAYALFACSGAAVTDFRVPKAPPSDGADLRYNDGKGLRFKAAVSLISSTTNNVAFGFGIGGSEGYADYNTNSRRIAVLYDNTDGNLYFVTGTSSAYQATDLTALGIVFTNTNDYYMVFDGTSAKLYVNGALLATHTTVPNENQIVGWGVYHEGSGTGARVAGAMISVER